MMSWFPGHFGQEPNRKSMDMPTPPNSPRHIPVIPLPTLRWCPVARPKHLMSYEAAAKAIFVRANGTAAYYLATGIKDSG